MPAKRRVAAVESDSEAAGSQASKKARTAGDSEVEAEEASAPRASGSGTRGTQQSIREPVDVDEEDIDMNHDGPDEDDEKKFEEEHEEEIRLKVIGGPKGQGVSPLAACAKVYRCSPQVYRT